MGAVCKWEGMWEENVIRWGKSGSWWPCMPSCLRGWTVSCGHRVPLKGFQRETKIMKVIIKVSQRRMCTVGKRGKTEMEMGEGGQSIFNIKYWPLRKLKNNLCVSCVDQSSEGSTALEKESAIACATSTPVAQIHPLFGRCSAVSLTLFPIGMNSTTGFRFLIQVRSCNGIFQISGHSHYQKAFICQGTVM